ncbi:N-terminal EF-hand calcium-binding protein 1 isoform X2 [Nematostella vectensis]|uniref:N-terminal EF-hand calcium-binding protein 1 isoform X2 n=1 Tax=Nematostella vectensis TaxID=45351 RepID=UPI00138FF2EB|nr:N-terminal EF-hand calcium-binding protein 1 isoform X2 [Nematostella vectensis]
MSEAKGKSIFLDVFRRADKNDDGALSWEEFSSFFSDGILSTEDLKKLFAEIDTHNTSNIDTSELYEYFKKEMGPFEEVFAGLEEMNSAVSNALIQSAKLYPEKRFFGKFATRFLLKEVLGQMNSLQHQVDVAVDKIDENEQQSKSTEPSAEAQSPARPGRASQVKSALTAEVNRLAEIIDKIENKVKFDVIEEEEVDMIDNKMAIIVCRKFQVFPMALAKFRTALKTYIGATSQQNGCLHLCVRSFTRTDSFTVYEIWANADDLHRHFACEFSKAFMHSNIDLLERPEDYSKMAVPESWWN